LNVLIVSYQLLVINHLSEEMLVYSFYILLGFLPSFIWLLFYLRKDSHPEPKKQILKIFIWGMLIAPLAAILEFLLYWLINPSLGAKEIIFSFGSRQAAWQGIIALVAIAPLVEEYLKYKIVRVKIIDDPSFDEPLDAMIYLIAGALGFAAVENLIAILESPLVPLSTALGIISFRFLGATFLHVLASAIVGYYLAKSLPRRRRLKRASFIAQGLALAIFFHGVYNYLIRFIGESPEIVILIAFLLIAMAIFVARGFRKLKKELSVCKI